MGGSSIPLGLTSAVVSINGLTFVIARTRMGDRPGER